MASPLEMYSKFEIRLCSAKIVILVGKQPMAECYSISGHIYYYLNGQAVYYYVSYSWIVQNYHDSEYYHDNHST